MPQTSAIATHAERGTSWMLPEAQKTRGIIYAGDGSDGLCYDYKTGTQVGTLTGFDEHERRLRRQEGRRVSHDVPSVPRAPSLSTSMGETIPIKTFSTDGHPIEMLDRFRG